jgi:uncharacterized protein YjbI with pentapeptide repeats
MSDAERASFAKDGLSKAELSPFSPEERRAFHRDFAIRIGCDDASLALLSRNDSLGSDRKNGFKEILDNATLQALMPPTPGRDHPEFSFTHFVRTADFAGYLFWGSANFLSAKFSASANFQSAKFCEHALFWSATFSSDADFRSAKFDGVANFRSVTFSYEANFRGTVFSGDANFESAKFSGRPTFSVAQFRGEVAFINACFPTLAQFSYSLFLGSGVPDFRGATLHEGTEWHGAVWPKPPRDHYHAQAQVYAYERLKMEMDRLKKHEDEQRFFRKELRARRGLSRFGSAEWILNILYQTTSNYGQSVALPVLWLFALFATGGAVFYLMHAITPGTAAITIPHAAALSFANIFPFVPISHELLSATPVIGWSRIEKAVGVAQALIGTPLLFLFGLALRNRFRMK